MLFTDTPRARRTLIRLLLLGGVGAGVVACAADAPQGAPDADTAPALGPADGADLAGMDLGRIQVGDEAPDFTLASFEGEPVTLSDFRGEANVLLVFYRGHW
jgi:cytochrome oxidase Cu insertion factor (SCO1/SenC/PrrC family)